MVAEAIIRCFKDIEDYECDVFANIHQLENFDSLTLDSDESYEDRRSTLARGANDFINKIADLLLVIETQLQQYDKGQTEDGLWQEKLTLSIQNWHHSKERLKHSLLKAHSVEMDMIHKQRIEEYVSFDDNVILKDKLFAGRSVKAPTEDPEKKVQDQILSQNKNITSSLKLTKQLMTMSVMQTELNIESLDQQSKDLSQLNDKLMDLEGVLKKSKQIVKFIEQQDKRDKKRIYLSIAFLFCCCAWVIWRRVLKTPFRLLFWSIFKFFGILNWATNRTQTDQHSTQIKLSLTQNVPQPTLQPVEKVLPIENREISALETQTVQSLDSPPVTETEIASSTSSHSTLSMPAHDAYTYTEEVVENLVWMTEENTLDNLLNFSKEQNLYEDEIEILDDKNDYESDLSDTSGLVLELESPSSTETLQTFQIDVINGTESYKAGDQAVDHDEVELVAASSQTTQSQVSEIQDVPIQESESSRGEKHASQVEDKGNEKLGVKRSESNEGETRIIAATEEIDSTETHQKVHLDLGNETPSSLGAIVDSGSNTAGIVNGELLEAEVIAEGDKSDTEIQEFMDTPIAEAVPVTQSKNFSSEKSDAMEDSSSMGTCSTEVAISLEHGGAQSISQTEIANQAYDSDEKSGTFDQIDAIKRNNNSTEKFGKVHKNAEDTDSIANKSLDQSDLSFQKTETTTSTSDINTSTISACLEEIHSTYIDDQDFEPENDPHRSTEVAMEAAEVPDLSHENAEDDETERLFEASTIQSEYVPSEDGYPKREDAIAEDREHLLDEL